jgi:hypothetical protein
MPRGPMRRRGVREGRRWGTGDWVPRAGLLGRKPVGRGRCGTCASSANSRTASSSRSGQARQCRTAVPRPLGRTRARRGWILGRCGQVLGRCGISPRPIDAGKPRRAACNRVDVQMRGRWAWARASSSSAAPLLSAPLQSAPPRPARWPCVALAPFACPCASAHLPPGPLSGWQGARPQGHHRYSPREREDKIYRITLQDAATNDTWMVRAPLRQPLDRAWLAVGRGASERADTCTTGVRAPVRMLCAARPPASLRARRGGWVRCSARATRLVPPARLCSTRSISICSARRTCASPSRPAPPVRSCPPAHAAAPPPKPSGRGRWSSARGAQRCVCAPPPDERTRAVLTASVHGLLRGARVVCSRSQADGVVRVCVCVCVGGGGMILFGLLL